MNNAWAFYFEVPFPLQVEEIFTKVALTEIEIKLENDKKTIEEDLYIFTDIIKRNTLINEEFKPLLRIISSKEPSICIPYYFKLSRESFSRVFVYLTDQHGEIPKYKAICTRLTLHFTK